jgi:hypothetical protein
MVIASTFVRRMKRRLKRLEAESVGDWLAEDVGGEETESCMGWLIVLIKR